MRGRLTQLIVNTALAMVAGAVAVGLCEIGARLFLTPADYLSVTTIQDDILGMRLAPNSAGMDAWGFRNPTVPPSVDVVAVGDSHTFGNTATMYDAWPSILARHTGLRVYNLGLGGYGPNQYYHLMKTRALSLKPRWVLCGLYMGDDFENAFSVTYDLAPWSHLRQGQWEHANADIWDQFEPVGPLKGIRNWLSRQSLAYRLVVHGPVLGALKEGWRFSEASAGHDPSVTVLTVEERGIREAFRPAGMVTRLDQSRAEVREGMRITFDLLAEMNRLCQASDCTFAVVVIPTKETVFADALLRDRTLHLYEAVDRVVINERLARAELTAFLEAHDIPYVDTLPVLSRAVEDHLYAATTADMHPGRNGYRVIAKAAASLLDETASGSRSDRGQP